MSNRMIRLRRGHTEPWTFYSRLTAFGLRLFFDFTDDTPSVLIVHETSSFVSDNKTFRRRVVLW